MKQAIFVLLASSVLLAQAAVKPAPSAIPGPDAGLAGLLGQVQVAAQKSDDDLARLRIEKWKTDAASRQQAQTSAASIRRNLANAVPELVQKVQSDPSSLSANFRLYRNFNALYDTFSALVESAGAFGPNDQYTQLANDVAQIDQLRHQLAERMDQLAGSSDAELVRLRAHSAASSGKPIPRTVVDDNKPAAKPSAKKKPKTSPQPSQP